MPTQATTSGQTRRRVRFECKRCGSTTNAPPDTVRASEGLCRSCFGKGKDKRPRELNDLEGAEWARYSKSIEVYPDTRTDKQREHGACFPKSLASQQIEIFTKVGQTVFDPFVGVGTTLEAAVSLGRPGIGIDLNPRFLELARADLTESDVSPRLVLIEDDARNLEAHLEPESVDFILTSPPYATLLKSVKGAFAYKWREHSHLDPVENPRPYSSRSEDLGNMQYDGFMDAMVQIMASCRTVAKPETYAVWVVKDYRDIKKGIPYVNFHGDIITAAEEAGWLLWDIRIFDQTKFRPLVCLGFPSRNFYLNIGHSYMLTLKKTSRA